MLEKLNLKNFRRHRDLTVNFTQGINAIRAANEGGKTSSIEACAYALFGSKALRTSLDDAVTWGEDVKSLKVELTLSSGGKTYTFSRSKAGAEVTLDGNVFCTGQNEVSAFAASLLGADQSIAANLIVANQGNIRGALEQGPKALSQLIEDLAGFTVFDQILERAQEKLTLGSPALLEERLKGAEATLAAATESLPVKPDMEHHQAVITALSNKIAQTEAGMQALKDAAAMSSIEFSEASEKFLKRAELERNVERAKEQVNQAKANVAGHAANASKPLHDLTPLKRQLENAEQWEARIRAFSVWESLPVGDRYVGTAEQYEANVVEVTREIRTAESKLNDIERKITAAKGRRINHDKCDKCGQDVTHLTHVVETNAAVDAEIAQLVPQQADLIEYIRVQRLEQSELDACRSLMNKLQPMLNKLTGFIELDYCVTPPAVSWVGEVPGEIGPNVDAYRRQLAEAEVEVKAIEQAKAKLEVVQGQLTEAEANLAALEAKLATIEAPTSDEVLNLERAKNDAANAVTIAEGEIIIAKREMADLQREFEAANKMWNMAQARVSDAEATIEETKKGLESLAFNNALVKKLRAIRPIVANQVWNSVLTSVSVMFSQIRGEESWVTKEKDGFKVNGQAIESLSGSTLDVLGVALRVALLRTFLPGCGLLVLDEPAQGCDESRTESLLGFIASSGIGQSILITHESISESIADNLIEL